MSCVEEPPCGGSKWDGESNKDVQESWYWCSREAVDGGVDDWMQYSILSLFGHEMRVNDNDFVDCMRKNEGKWHYGRPQVKWVNGLGE